MKEKTRVSTKRIVMIALFTALIAVGTFVRIDTPAMSFTLQFLFVVAAGMILGKKDGAISVAAYIVLGLFGLPIFARGGGPAYVLQPSFGYIMAFIPAAYISGRFTEQVTKEDKTSKRKAVFFWRPVLAAFIALIVEYAIGAVYYWGVSTFYFGDNIGLKQLMLYCVVLVLPGDMASCLIAALVARRLRNIHY